MENPITTTDDNYDIDAELERRRADGSLIKMKARMLLETEGLPAVFGMLKSEKVPEALKLEANKFLMKLGDLEPKQSQQVATGPGFSITINLGESNEPKTVSVAPASIAEVSSDDEVVEGELVETILSSVEELPPAPTQFKIPDFSFADDLSPKSAAA